ncbi:multifunctional expression regulator/transactivator [Murid herpesvirus 3]|uniref:mRNA export factor ICP27 homolog n=2 Tax=Murid betaherpesvirus 3 TaxID=2560603 RepID=A0A1P8VIU9_9BETA|nr:multifunctional expression regulator/transactivator [Murine roseolovirus]APZ76271.1 multifunctional expression regulator/transactivator [Murid betaherpesvirus 3]AYH64732.1 multifunctional expression regulator/transactivator [Murid herpesvirus 3]
MFRPENALRQTRHERFTKISINGHRIIKRTMNTPYKRSPSRTKKLIDCFHSTTLDEKKLDALSINELEELKDLIEKRQEEKRIQTYGSKPLVKPYTLEKYDPKQMGLREYTGEARHPRSRLRDKMTRTHEKIFFYQDDLLNTDLIFNYRRYMDSLSRQQNQELIGERIFSVSNSPSLTFTLATLEEAYIYLKYHYIHQLPMNIFDMFFYTSTVIKYSFFTKMNLNKLSCILNDFGDGELQYRIFRLLSGKPVVDMDIPYTEEDLQRKKPGFFKHPIQQAMSFVIHFTKITRKLKEIALKSEEPQFLKDYDPYHIFDHYQCGMITNLVIGQLKRHQCDDMGCQHRIQRSLSPWKSSLFFCVYPDTGGSINAPPEMPTEVYHLAQENGEKSEDIKKELDPAKLTAKTSKIKIREKHDSAPNIPQKIDNVEPSCSGAQPEFAMQNKSQDKHTAKMRHYDTVDSEEEMELDYDENCDDESFSDESV